jgi:hypothetical protein
MHHEHGVYNGRTSRYKVRTAPRLCWRERRIFSCCPGVERFVGRNRLISHMSDSSRNFTHLDMFRFYGYELIDPEQAQIEYSAKMFYSRPYNLI